MMKLIIMTMIIIIIVVVVIIIIIYSFIKMQHKMTMYNWRTGHARLGSVRALKSAPKLHNYDSTRNKNSDTQKYTHT